MQQSSPASSSSDTPGTLPGVLPDQRLVVTSTGLQTDGGDAANITGATAYERISSIEDNALGVNLASPYKRLIRCAACAFFSRGGMQCCAVPGL